MQGVFLKILVFVFCMAIVSEGQAAARDPGGSSHGSFINEIRKISKNSHGMSQKTFESFLINHIRQFDDRKKESLYASLFTEDAEDSAEHTASILQGAAGFIFPSRSSSVREGLMFSIAQAYLTTSGLISFPYSSRENSVNIFYNLLKRENEKGSLDRIFWEDEDRSIIFLWFVLKNAFSLQKDPKNMSLLIFILKELPQNVFQELFIRSDPSEPEPNLETLINKMGDCLLPLFASGRTSRGSIINELTCLYEIQSFYAPLSRTEKHRDIGSLAQDLANLPPERRTLLIRLLREKKNAGTLERVEKMTEFLRNAISDARGGGDLERDLEHLISRFGRKPAPAPAPAPAPEQPRPREAAPAPEQPRPAPAAAAEKPEESALRGELREKQHNFVELTYEIRDRFSLDPKALGQMSDKQQSEYLSHKKDCKRQIEETKEQIVKITRNIQQHQKEWSPWYKDFQWGAEKKGIVVNYLARIDHVDPFSGALATIVSQNPALPRYDRNYVMIPADLYLKEGLCVGDIIAFEKPARQPVGQFTLDGVEVNDTNSRRVLKFRV